MGALCKSSFLVINLDCLHFLLLWEHKYEILTKLPWWKCTLMPHTWCGKCLLFLQNSHVTEGWELYYAVETPSDNWHLKQISIALETGNQGISRKELNEHFRNIGQSVGNLWMIDSIMIDLRVFWSNWWYFF